jgi:hypothetical protein
MLGDISLEKRNKNCSIKFDYSSKHRVYANHIAEVFRHMV